MDKVIKVTPNCANLVDKRVADFVAVEAQQNCYVGDTDLDMKIKELVENFNAKTSYQCALKAIKHQFNLLAKKYNLDIDIEKAFDFILRKDTLDEKFVKSQCDKLTALIVARGIDAKYELGESFVKRDENGLLTSAINETFIKNLIYEQEKSAVFDELKLGNSSRVELSSLIAKHLNSGLTVLVNGEGFCLAEKSILRSSKSIKSMSYKDFKTCNKTDAKIMELASVDILQKAKLPINIQDIFCEKYTTKIGDYPNERYIKALLTNTYSYQIKFCKGVENNFDTVKKILSFYGLIFDYLKEVNNTIEVYVHCKENRLKEFISQLENDLFFLKNVRVSAINEIVLVVSGRQNIDMALRLLKKFFTWNKFEYFDIHADSEKIFIPISQEDFSPCIARLYYQVVDNYTNDCKV